jgi:enoyl-CoA hydratase
VAGGLRIERRGQVLLWTIHRPEVRNALDHATLEALAGAVRAAGAAARKRDAPRVVVLTAHGDFFAAGGDLRELRSSNTRSEARKLLTRGRAICDGIDRLPLPVIAALPGPAIGGGAELALACDLRVAEPRATLCFKHGRMGVTTAWGVLGNLVATAGAGASARLLLAGHEIDAREALRLGLVDAISEPGACLDLALSWAGDVGQAAPPAIAALKGLVRSAARGTAQLRSRESRAFVETWTGTDHTEAIEAFFGRRPPRWVAR